MAEWLCSGLQIRVRRFDSDLSLQKMKILITGSAGFIGFHLTRALLEEGHTIFSLDNLNDYYSIDLKKARLKILKNYKKFNFRKIGFKK